MPAAAATAASSAVFSPTPSAGCGASRPPNPNSCARPKRASFIGVRLVERYRASRTRSRSWANRRSRRASVPFATDDHAACHPAEAPGQTVFAGTFFKDLAREDVTNPNEGRRLLLRRQAPRCQRGAGIKKPVIRNLPPSFSQQRLLLKNNMFQEKYPLYVVLRIAAYLARTCRPQSAACRLPS